MKRIRYILISLVFLLIAGIHILLQSSFWRISIENFINSKLEKNSKWTINIPQLDGNLLSTVKGKEIKISHANGTEVIFGEFILNVDYISTLIHEPTLSLLRVEDFQIYPVYDLDSMSITKNNADSMGIEVLPGLTFTISDLVLDGDVHLSQINDSSVVNIKLDSRLKVKPKKKEFYINEFSASLNDTSGYILLRNTALTLLETSVHFAPASGAVNGLPFDGEVHYDWTKLPDLSGDLHFDTYSIPEQLFSNIPLVPKFSSIESFIHLESDLERFNGAITIINPLGLLMKGELSITRHENYYTLNRLGLESDETTLSISGLYEKSGRISGNMLLSHFDLSKWIKDQNETNVNGTLMVEGLIRKGRISDISVSMEVDESELYENRDISVSGTISYNNELLSVDAPLTVSIGPSTVTIKGFSDSKNKVLDLDLKLKEASIFLVNNFWSDSLNSGHATGDLHISGDMNNPSIRAELECSSIGYHKTYLDQFSVNVNWKPNDEGGGEGFLRGKIGYGSWRDIAFDDGIIDITFSKEGIVIQSAEIKQANNYLQVSGLMKPDSMLILDRMQIAFEDHYFINAKPFTVQFGKNKIDVLPFELHVDDGIASGYLTFEEQVQGHIHVSNVNADVFKLLTDDSRYHISGMSFGDVTIEDKEGSPEIDVNLKLKNGIVARQKFSELILVGNLYQSILNVDEISMIADERKRIFISGFIPVGKIDDNEREFDFIAQFDELDMSLLTQFMHSSTPMDGKISGSFHLGGNPNRTKYDFDMVIDDAKWGLLQMGKVTAEGLFDGKRIYLNKYTSSYKGSELSGSAFLPIDYNLSSENYRQYFPDDSMWVFVEGKTNNLEFLSAYISDVDSIIGDFVIELEIIGPIDHLIRNGKFTSHDATVYSVQLNDPIYHVNGNADLEKNQFVWKSLSGSMVKDPAKSDVENIFISGSMDMTHFFKPYYRFNIIGDQLHFRTLLGDMEGICNLDLTITGRDTIEIAGEIEPIDAVMYQEFTQNSDISTADVESSRQINYLLNFPITGDFALRNSQIDAHLSGELSMTKLGDRDSDFGGELFARGGKFYYYGVELTITDAYMAFDKKGFNPFLDVSGFTKIKNEQIYIQLVGQLDNPQLVLESSSGFSESDIIELLTIGNRFEDQEISAAGFGNQAQNILGAYLERQLEKNFLQVTGLGKMGLIDDVSISGTSGLIDPKNSDEFTISAERQISDNLSLNYSYRRSFSLSNPTMNKVGVELKLNKFVSLVGNVDETGNMHVKYRLRYSY